MPLFNIGFVIFPDLTQLDFTGPLQVLSRLPQSATHIVAKSAAPVPSDCGLGLVPTHTFANCPPLDLICIPGGSEGVAGIINDRETIAFVREQAGAAKYVTSVTERPWSVYQYMKLREASESILAGMDVAQPMEDSEKASPDRGDSLRLLCSVDEQLH